MSRMYAIVDVETTGKSVRNAKITEIAVVLFDGEKIVESFDTLINPECQIPPPITRLTGITNEMVRTAPKFYEVADRIVKLTRDAIFVAHSARFDYGFLRREFAQLGYTFTRKQLCTVRLSRKMFPGLPSYSLGTLIQHFGIKVTHRHRALADALATTELLRRALATPPGVAAAELLINGGVLPSRLPRGIDLDFLHTVPEETGVYYMYDAQDAVLYVGKALNIRKRLMQHFADRTTKGELIFENVAKITWEITGSELLALLRESAEIKRLKPKLNRVLRRRSMPFAVWSYMDADGYLCFDYGRLSAREVKKRGMRLLGQYPKAINARNHLAKVVDRFSLCLCLTGLDRVSRPCFHYHLKTCGGACIGKESASGYNLRAREAETYLLRYLEGMFLIVDHGRHEDEQVVVLFEQGRLFGYGYFSKTDSPPVSRLEEVRHHLQPAGPDPDAMRIIATWIKRKPHTVVYRDDVIEKR